MPRKGLLDYETAPTDVVVADGDTRGAVVFDKYGVTEFDRPARVAVDAGRFRTLLNERLPRLG